MMLQLRFHVICAIVLVNVFHIHGRAKASYACPKKFVRCECRPSNEEFVFSCPRPSSKKDLEYTVKYNERLNRVTLECTSITAELFDGMFEPFQFPSAVDTVHIYSCPSPNITFSSILRNFKTVTELRLILESQLSNSSLFHNLSSLETVTIEGSKVEALPDAMLQETSLLRNLTVTETALASIPSGFFNSTPNLASINLKSNRLKSLPEETFVNLSQLVQLVVSFNQLQELPQDLFSNLPQLRILQLNNNLLTQLLPTIFSKIPNLEHLDLSFNNFKDLPHDLFNANPNILTLSLQRNDNLTILPNDLFQNLTNLKELYLNHNNLSELDSSLLKTQQSLQVLHLNNNQLQRLPSELFESATSLIELDLSVNKLKSIPFGTFQTLNKLKFLRLRNNFLTEVTKNVFSFLPSLNILILSYNKISTIAPAAFDGDENMTALDISSNRLQLRETPFSLPTRLHFLNISHNEIAKIPSEWLPMTTLQMLNLSFNNIRAINTEQLRFVPKYVEVDVRMNQIEEVNMLDTEGDRNASMSVPVARKSEKQVRIFINHNPMKCDCNLLPFIRYLKQRNMQDDAVYHFEADQLHCSSPAGDFNYNTPLTSVAEDSVSCKVKNCIPTCTCLQNAVHRSVMVNCSDKNLVHLDVPNLPMNVTEVHFENNRLTSLKMVEKSEWANVTHIYLSRNNLQTIDQPVTLPSKLQLLTLDGNSIETMPPWLIETARARDGFVLTLGNNPWKCDCSALGLLQLLNSSQQIVNDVNKVKCGPGRFENQRLASLDNSTLCPLQQRIAATTPVAVMVVSTLILAFVIFVVAMLFVRNRDRIKLWFFRRHMCLWLRTEDDIEAGHPL